MKKFIWLSIFFVLLLIPISCGNDPQVLSESDQAQIYAVLIKRLYHDYQPGQVTGYIMKYTDDSAGIESENSNSKNLPESLQNAVINALADLDKTTLADAEKRYIWVSQASEIPEGVIFSPGGGCQIILGNIHPQKDGSVQVTASLFFGGTGGGGTTFIIEKIDNIWTVTGTTGAMWIS